jgi:hypothetical protein
LRDIISRNNIKAFESSYRLGSEGKTFEYEMTIRTKDKSNIRKLAQNLMEMEEVHEFKIIPS